MTRTTRAVIDVGTNSVKLLVAEVAGDTVVPLFEESEQTRLGRGFYESHRLQPEAIRQTAAAVAGYLETARRWQPATIRLIATSAARDAINRDELLHAVQQAAGRPLEVISGAQEADWAFTGVTSDPALRGADLLVVDIGGGSTEIVAGRDAHRQYADSFAIGTVRLLERLALSDPPTRDDYAQARAAVDHCLRQEVLPVLPSQISASHWLVGTGGTATILGRMELQIESYERSRLEGLVLTRDQIVRHEERLWATSLAERRAIPGLPAKRADVMLTGALIFRAMMETLDFAAARVSMRGLRFGAVRSELP